MDLSEIRDHAGDAPPLRHPWEQARVAAVKDLLAHAGIERAASALDIGCGDGYVAESLFASRRSVAVTAIDTEITDDHGGVLPDHDNIHFVRSYDQLEGKRFDLVLMLDVLEHIDDDSGALADIVNRSMADGGRIVITVPAFQWLFCAHDTFLRHCRRYSLRQLVAVAERAGLTVTQRGYLFGSLMPVRALSVMAQRLSGPIPPPKGVGGWGHGPLMTTLLTSFLAIDNAILLFLARRGLRLPGLTSWVVCEKSS